MPNIIFDNVIRVDSSMGNLNVVGGASSNITNYNVIGFSFWSADTSGNCIFAGADTTQWIWRASYMAAVVGSGAIIPSTQSISFASPLRLSALKIPTLTAGSAFVYLS